MSAVLVLGGTSWVGGQIAREALCRGHEITCVARGESGSPPPGAGFVRADRDVPGAYDQLRDRAWDLVFDVARQPGHVRGAVRALGSVAEHWTFVSTGSVYADQSGFLAEDSPLLTALAGDRATAQEYGEGKVACEQAVTMLPRHLVLRAGLIGGPGDLSDRLGYYVARFASAQNEPVLVPDVPDQAMQVLDVRDLAGWAVRAAESGTTGVLQAVGEPTTIGELVRLSAQAADFASEQVAADPGWLHDHAVQEWMGPRSLPLWLPGSHHGMGLMDDARALQHGLRRRPLVETIRDVLAYERELGLSRPRKAGLTRVEELALIGLSPGP